MNWKLIIKALITVLFIGFLLHIENTYSDVTSSGSTTNTQSNNAGSNTAITGGYESSTTYQSGSSSNTTTNNETNNSTNQKTAVNSANASLPSLMSQDSCVIPLSAGVTIIGFSGTFGSYYVDKNCERRKTAKLLKQLGMTIASVSVMCDDPLVFESMLISGSPCPVLTDDGRSVIGKEATQIILERRKQKTVNSKPSMTWNHMLENE
tara:strand:- start:11639 stop:12262 length:624 start_codon:yes stop_codon:yes gene_type:complete